MDDFRNSQQSVFIVQDSVLDLLMNCALWDTSARIEKDPMSYKIYGSATDSGLINFFIELMGDKVCFERQQSLKRDKILK